MLCLSDMKTPAVDDGRESVGSLVWGETAPCQAWIWEVYERAQDTSSEGGVYLASMSAHLMSSNLSSLPRLLPATPHIANGRGWNHGCRRHLSGQTVLSRKLR